MATIHVTHVADDAFEVDVRGHALRVDQRRPGAAGPTPVELFVASLAACAGHFAVDFLRGHHLAYQGLEVHCDWTMRAGEPARVGRVTLRVVPPAFVPRELGEALRAAVDRCTVHNSLRRPPPVTIELHSGVSVPG